MQTLVEQNKQQARQILIQNPVLTKALFQVCFNFGVLICAMESLFFISLGEGSRPIYLFLLYVRVFCVLKLMCAYSYIGFF